MFGAKNSKDNNANQKSSAESKKHAKAVRKRARQSSDMVWLDGLRPDGIAYVGDDWWSATVEISDVNYVLASIEAQKKILNEWMGVLNMFDENTRVQVTSANRVLDGKALSRGVRMSGRGDGLDGWRDAFNDLTFGQLKGLASSTVTDKYVTISVQETDQDKAVRRLNRLVASLRSQLAAMGCQAEKMDREARLRVLQLMLQPGEPFTFSEKAFAKAPKNMRAKDFIVPWAMDFTDKDRIKLSSMNEVWMSHVWLDSWPAQLTDTLVSDLADIPSQVVINVHIAPWDRADGLEKVKAKQAGVKQEYDRSVQSLARQGLTAESVPDSITERVDEMTSLLDQLRSSNQRILDTLVLVSVSASSKDELDMVISEVQRVARRLSCRMSVARYMMPEALNAMLPLGVNRLPMRRALTTDSASILIPFTAQEIMEPHGLFYGVNERSGNPVIVNRAAHMNSNGFILGTTGSGKSQSAKAEIAQRVLDSADRVVIIDPEHEYVQLAQALGGTVVTVSADSAQHMNPLDIDLMGSDDTDPVRAKVSVVLDLLGSLMGGTTGLSQLKRSMIDTAAMNVYRIARSQLNATGRYDQPTLVDLKEQIRRLYVDVENPSPEASDLVTELEMFTTGSSSGFAHTTDVNLNGQFTVFDVSGLSGQVQTFGMMVIIDQVWSMVVRNRDSGLRTWLYVDELHRFFHNEYSIRSFLDIYKRARKYGLGVTGITQNIDELLSNDQARLMLSNADFLLLMNQKTTDATMLQELLELSDGQVRLMTNARSGNGLLNTNGVSLGVDNRMDQGNLLARLYSTKFGDQPPVLSQEQEDVEHVATQPAQETTADSAGDAYAGRHGLHGMW